MRKLSFLIIGLICLTLVSALEISEDYDTNVLIKDIDSSIDLTLNITDAQPGVYNLYTLSDVSIKPSETFTIIGSSKIKKFTIQPNENLDVEGYYKFTYTLNYRGIEKFDKKFTVNVLNLEDAIEIGSDSINPESDNITFYIKNKENVRIENLSAEFSSILFEKKLGFDLEPNEKKIIPITVDPDKLKKTKAGVYVLEGIFKTNKEERILEGNLFLGEKKGITSLQETTGFLIRTETATKANSGNVLETVQITMKRNIFSRLFTLFDIEPTDTQRKGLTVEYTWIKERLKPAEVYIVKASTNYIFPFFIIVVAVLALLGLKRFGETKLEIKKSVTHVKTKGGQFALKIILSIKSRKAVENVTLIDKIPAIVKIYNQFGLVKPDKIDPESRRLHWYIGDMAAGEERTFNYIVYSKVGVVGKFSLPEAIAVFEKNGNIHEVGSNKVFFMSDQIKGN